MSIEEIIKIRLKLSELSPEILLDIEEVKTKAVNFCNLLEGESLSAGLNFTIVNMVMDLIKRDAGEETTNNVKSISMGDTSYDFDTTVRIAKIDLLMRDYESDLIKYRRIRK